MDKKHIILKTAFQLFLKNGFSEVSANEVIREAQVTKGGFYHYFKSKDDLINEVIKLFVCPYFKEPFDTLIEEIKENGIYGKVEKRLRDCYMVITVITVEGCYEEMGTVDFRDFQFLVYEGMKKYPYLADLNCQYTRKRRQLMRQLLEEGKQEGVIAESVDTEVYAMTMIALRDGMIALQVLDPAIDAKEKCDITFHSLWNEIKAG